MICRSCPRNCGVNREEAYGACGVPSGFRLARAALHFWEEPCISGREGSGAVFFSGCPLSCVFCQNEEISHGGKGKDISDEALINIFQRLEAQGANNINLVSPTHYAPQLARVLQRYRPSVPVVYNTSGYEKAETLKLLEGLVDIYLPDLKYIRPEKAARYSGAADYFDYAAPALAEMRRQQPKDVFDERGIMQKGVIIRHLILPANTNSSIEILRFLRENYPDTYISLMAQYTPCNALSEVKEINRPLTKREYDKVVNAALDMGFEKLFLQELSAADKKFIPPFDFSGIM